MKVSSLSDCGSRDTFLADFCKLPGRVRKEPFRVSGVSAEDYARMLETPGLAQHESWLCYLGSRAIARLAANISLSSPNTGYFGLLEFDVEAAPPEVPLSLLGAARSWLLSCGVRNIVGPVTFNTWFPYRLRLSHDDGRHFDWAPDNPPEHVDAVEAAGFKIGQRYCTTAFGNLEAVVQELEPAYRQARAAQFAFRPVVAASLAGYADVLYRVTHAAFRNNYLFEPIQHSVFARYFSNTVNKEHETVVWFILNRDGEPVGFLYTFIDQCRPDSDTETAIVLKTIALEPEFRGYGLSNALAYLALRRGLEQGVDYAIAALVQKGNHSESYARKGQYLWRHEYALWEK